MSELIAPSGRRRRGGVLVIHSWWGLTDSFRDFGRRLAERGYHVALADLFGGRSARTPAEARRLRAAPRREPMYKSLIRDLQEVQARAGPDSPVGAVGFSMGGHWAVWLSQRPELPVASAVLYYAARAGDFSAGRASYLAHFAARDEWVTKTARRTMERRIAAAGRPYAAHDYPGTGHWFAETARPEHDAAAADRAFARTLAHLEATLPR